MKNFVFSYVLALIEMYAICVRFGGRTPKKKKNCMKKIYGGSEIVAEIMGSPNMKMMT